jgi:hypothetical protein
VRYANYNAAIEMARAAHRTIEHTLEVSATVHGTSHDRSAWRWCWWAPAFRGQIFSMMASPRADVGSAYKLPGFLACWFPGAWSMGLALAEQDLGAKRQCITYRDSAATSTVPSRACVIQVVSWQLPRRPPHRFSQQFERPFSWTPIPGVDSGSPSRMHGSIRSTQEVSGIATCGAITMTSDNKPPMFDPPAVIDLTTYEPAPESPP